ncbi:FAD-binding domain-containing protein [Tropicimonas sp. S265A]|uniref:FAD-binding domain-containing protein n=1 Tax=Tropicimonas sp. S265A TaxID=3415134 RepID=UPI003C7D9648
MTYPLRIDPTRSEGLRRLQAFVPAAGADYTRLRNYDYADKGHPHVSTLSPYIRHRLLTEEEVLRAVLGRHSPGTASKFVQEVFWRTYWKGWLEMRPSVWTTYKADLNAALDRVHTEAGLRSAWEDACRGETDIDAFNAWAHELVETGYMHNHARMWFASIWIFTLRLPWELGADFFLRHLLDGDAASNTLSWRWVAGLQTHGKNYVARASNISKFTDGRHRPLHQLTPNPEPLTGPPHPPRMDPPRQSHWDRSLPLGLLISEDDLSPGYLFAAGVEPQAAAFLGATANRSPLHVSQTVTAFVDGAIADTADRYADRLGGDLPVLRTAQGVVDWANAQALSQIVMPYTPTGPAADVIAEVRQAAPELAIIPVLREWDLQAWPHATAGFFKFKDKIPQLLGAVKGLKAA